jgi:hypothetical protein|tara:strand:+ start:107 stop:562 length:456 start_codon:yes stop_codon:yes gene_type:complete
MEITIKLQCPKCKTDINSRYETNILENEATEENFHEEKIVDNSFFNIMKNATLKSDETSFFFDDIYKAVGKECFEASKIPKAVQLIQNYFNDLTFAVNTTDDPRELLKISSKLAKAKAVVRKDVQKEINKQKKKVLGLIKKKVKGLKKKKK